jgi:hypothetical protein
MNTSPELEEQLKQSLDRLTDGARLRAGVAPLIRRRAHRVQRARYTAMAGAAAVITAAALTVTSGGTASPRPAQDEAYVISHVTSALVQTDDVLHTVSTDPGGRYSQAWYTQDAARIVEPVIDAGYHRSGAAYVNEFVNYQKKTWSESKASHPGLGIVMATQRGCHQPVTSSLAEFNWRSYIREMLGCGAFKVTRHTPAVLVLTESTGFTTETLQVSPATYLPVRMSWSFQGPLRQWNEHTDFWWLPPTAANLAHLTITIPPGFHRVSAAG